jgi:hypothetical protein
MNDLSKQQASMSENLTMFVARLCVLGFVGTSFDLLFGVCFFVFLTLVAPPIAFGRETAKAQNKTSSGAKIWKIEYLPGQTSAASTVYLGKDCIKIETKGSFEIVAHAPDWTATVVNKNKRYSCERQASRWMKEGLFMDPPEKGYMNPKRADSEQKINFRGIPAIQRKWNTLESDAFYRYRSQPKRCVIELVTADGAIPVSKMQLELLSVWYGIPYLSGVPLFWQNVMPAEKSLRLKTSNVSLVPENSVSFKPLAGCVKQSSMMALVDNKYSQAVTDFIEFEPEIGGTKKPAKPQTGRADAPDGDR